MVLEKLRAHHPAARPELDFRNDFELLIAVILSAQCTDVRVNKVTKNLFAEAPTPRDLAALPVDKTQDLIRSCGLYRNKTKFIRATSQILVDKFGGSVPDDYEELLKLPGVSRKTANVVSSIAFGRPAIAVDTHVFRVSRRIGLSRGKNELAVEKDLMRLFPDKYWTELHHLIIFHGRYICKAAKPSCEICNIKPDCHVYKTQDFRPEKVKAREQ